MSEIEAFPRAVLAHHWPGIPLHGDFTTIQSGAYEPIQLLVGGTPCQSFSVAGLRGGLADERGNLALEFLRLAQRLRPRWVVWENVPGVLSSWSDAEAGRDGSRWQSNDFDCFTGGLSELGYGWAWRVMDAQYAGVPQRRRRVFVVGCLGDWRRAVAVLFERHSLSGHPAPRREAGQAVAGSLGAGAPRSGGRFGRREAAANQLVAFGGNNTAGAIDVATAVNAHGGPHGRLDFESETFIAHALRADGFDASEDGTGRGTPLVPVSVDLQNLTMGGDVAGTLDTTRPTRGGGQAIAYQDVADPITAVFHKHHGASGGKDSIPRNHITQGLAVRRLTPMECERLQGFPDDYTLVPYRGKPAADGPRYKALGNSMAVPCMKWIGRRIAAVDALIAVDSAA